MYKTVVLKRNVNSVIVTHPRVVSNMYMFHISVSIREILSLLIFHKAVASEYLLCVIGKLMRMCK